MQYAVKTDSTHFVIDPTEGDQHTARIRDGLIYLYLIQNRTLPIMSSMQYGV
jgi:hypothetical protein